MPEAAEKALHSYFTPAHATDVRREARNLEFGSRLLLQPFLNPPDPLSSFNRGLSFRPERLDLTGFGIEFLCAASREAGERERSSHLGHLLRARRTKYP